MRAALAAVLSIARAACAGAPSKSGPPAAYSGAAAGRAAPVPGAQPSADPRTMMIDLAVSMLGQPYRYGGAAPGGFDVGSSRVDLQACKLEYSIVSPK